MRHRTTLKLVMSVLAPGLVLAAAWYALWLPGERHVGPLPPLTAIERDIGDRLGAHVRAIASRPHNTGHPHAYEAAARYIESTLAEQGYTAERQAFDVPGHRVRNIFVRLPAATPDADVLVVGAHYDSAFDSPGANDNGTGAAALLELARLLRNGAPLRNEIQLVFFANEEPPWWGTPHMGSVHFAKALTASGRHARGMISLETIGAFSDAPGSQSYPFPLGAGFPGKADFIAFVALPRARALLHDVIGSFRRHTPFPTIGGVGPSFIDGLAWSDHAAFEAEGIAGLMITDTALYRYPHYHKPTDTPDKIDYARLARVTAGLERTLREIAR